MSSESPKNTRVIDCINNNDYSKLKSLLERYFKQSDASPKISKLDLNNCFLYASKKNSTKCLEVFCQLNLVDVNFLDDHGMSAVLYAADRHNLEALKLLVEHGADPTVCDREGTTALMYSCKWGASDCLQFLINLSIDIPVIINQKNKDGFTALKYAAQFDYFECVLSLINAKVDLNSTDAEGYSPLMHSLKRDHLRIAELLIDKNADVHVVGQDGKTALSLAFHLENYDLVDSILSHSRRISLPNDQHPYLHKMIAKKNKKIVRRLLIKGCLPTDWACKDSCFKFQVTVCEVLSPICVALLSKQGDIAKYFVVNRLFSPNDRSKLLENISKIKIELEQQQPEAADSLAVIDYLNRHSDLISSDSNDDPREAPEWPHSKLCWVHWNIIPLDHPFKTEPCNCTECIDGVKVQVVSECRTFQVL